MAKYQTVEQARKEAPIQRNWSVKKQERLAEWLADTDEHRGEEFEEIETHRGYAIVWYPGAIFKWDAETGEATRLIG